MHFEDNDSNLIFHSDKSPFILDFEYKSYDVFNSLSYKFPTQKNKLFLFPSKLEHHVEEQIKDSDRMSLSFNTWVKGFVGNQENLTYMEI